MVDSTRLDQQTAIVTGAAQGIGKAVALTLAEAGATIVVGDLQDARGRSQRLSQRVAAP